MRTRRLARLALLVLPLAPAVCAPVRGAAADGGGADALTIATEWVSLESAAKPGDPLRADRAPDPVDLTDARPASIRVAPAPEGSARYGELTIGKTKVAFAVARGAGAALTLCIDANGDGSFAGDGESVTVQGDPVIDTSRGGGEQTNWKVADAKVGDAAITLAAVERPLAFAGWLRLPPREDEKPLGDVRLKFSAERPLTVAKPPGLAGSLLYATATVEGKPVVLAVARGAGDSLTVVVDANSDNDLTQAGERRELVGEPVKGRAAKGTRRIGTSWETADGFVVWGHKASVQMSEIPADLSLTVNVAGSRRGKATVDGKPYALYLLDADLDGKVSSEDDLWWFGPADRFGENERPMYATMFEATEPSYSTSGSGGAGGATWRLSSVAKDGTAVVTPSNDAGGLEDYLRRRTERVNRKRWFPQFDDEAAEFAKKQSLDGTRPKASAEPAWHFLLDLDAAQALAAKEGKPLLADFEADWCVWCKRLDYYTYPDREVCEGLAKFTLVKINKDLDLTRRFATLKNAAGKAWGGIPALGIFGPDGKPLRFPMVVKKEPGSPAVEVDHIAGWFKPEMIVAGLKSAYAAWEQAKTAGGTPPAPSAPAMDGK